MVLIKHVAPHHIFSISSQMAPKIQSHRQRMQQVCMHGYIAFLPTCSAHSLTGAPPASQLAPSIAISPCPTSTPKGSLPHFPMQGKRERDRCVLITMLITRHVVQQTETGAIIRAQYKKIPSSFSQASLHTSVLTSSTSLAQKTARSPASSQLTEN